MCTTTLSNFQNNSICFFYREINRQIAQENLKLAKEQKERQQYLNNVVYKNVPTAAYFGWFNKSTR